MPIDSVIARIRGLHWSAPFLGKLAPEQPRFDPAGSTVGVLPATPALDGPLEPVR